MADKKHAGAVRTAATLSSIFGGTRQQLAQPEIARDVPAISLYNRRGYFERQVSINDVKKMLKDLGMSFNESALPDALVGGIKLKSGELLKLAKRVNFGK